jgi:hypothetical protein
MKYPLVVEIEVSNPSTASGCFEFTLNRVAEGRFEYRGFLILPILDELREVWECSEVSALRYYCSGLQGFIDSIRQDFKVISDDQNFLPKVSYCCGNDDCRTMLFKGYGDVHGVEVVCKKCKRISPPFNFK